MVEQQLMARNSLWGPFCLFECVLHSETPRLVPPPSLAF